MYPSLERDKRGILISGGSYEKNRLERENDYFSSGAAIAICSSCDMYFVYTRSSFRGRCTDPLPEEGKEEEPEQPKAWVWHLTGTCPESLSFKIPEEENGVQIILNGIETKILCDGDEYVILSERVRMSVKKIEGEWKVYLDGTECGFFRYE